MLAAIMDCAAGTPFERQREIIKAHAEGERSEAVLLAGLEDPNEQVRLTALNAVLLLPNADRFEALLEHSDPSVRAAAFQAVIETKKPTIATLETLLADPSTKVRLACLEHIATSRAIETDMAELLASAVGDDNRDVRNLAQLTLWRQFGPEANAGFPEHASEGDSRFALPTEGWKFRPDPDFLGAKYHWQSPDAETDASGWGDIAIGQPWQQAGHHFEGVAWYWLTLEPPEKLSGANRVFLCFEGVDTLAWVWLNGVFVGWHDLGWDQEFHFDVTDLLQPQAPNQLVVRVDSVRGQGGIWKPVAFIRADP